MGLVNISLIFLPKTLGFLRKNLAIAPRSTKEVAYKTLVRPNCSKLEYAAPIWSPYCKISDTTGGECTEDDSPLDLQEVAQH